MKKKRIKKSKPSPLPGLTLPRSIRKSGQCLFNQQLWCWGADVRREAGNLLLAYGFHRQRPPANQQGGSMYSLQLTDGTYIYLWGFGLLYGKDAEEALFLKRSDFIPRLLPKRMISSTIWKPEQLPRVRKPRTLNEIELAITLLSQSLHWISDYETWVWEMDTEHRQETVTSWKKATIPADTMIATWLSLSQECQKLCADNIKDTCLQN